jgi:hypothetical protein
MTGTAMSFAFTDLHRAAPARRAPLWFAAPAAALLYPFTLMVFHAATAGIAAGSIAAWGVAALSLLLAILLPVLALLAALRLARTAAPTAAARLAVRVAMLAVAAPPLFTFIGVICILLKAPALDVWCSCAMWIGLALAIAGADYRRPAPAPAAVGHARLRMAHGSVAAVVLLYVAMHLANHLFGLLGSDAHAAVMKVLRMVYRSPWVEPVLLAGFAFLILSGASMAWRITARVTDAWRAFQVAAGIYLVFAILSHVNAVLYLARVHLGIETDWAFATGAPAGMLADAWNIRLVPYYLLAVFFVVSHAFAGLRVVLLAHGVRRARADAVMLGGSGLAALLAAVIVLAMCGVRVGFMTVGH